MEKPISVICVDDNPLVTEALRVRLELDGFSWAGSMPTADGLSAAVKLIKPDVVLLDIDMPGKSAFEAMREITQQRPATKTIVYSAHVRADWVDQAIEAGAWGYVAKSVYVTDIMDAVRKVAAGQIVFDKRSADAYFLSNKA